MVADVFVSRVGVPRPSGSTIVGLAFHGVERCVWWVAWCGLILAVMFSVVPLALRIAAGLTSFNSFGDPVQVFV